MRKYGTIIFLAFLLGSCGRGNLIMKTDTGEMSIKIDDRIYGPYEIAFYPAFAKHSTNFGFAYKESNRYYVNIDDRIFGPYSFADSPGFLSYGELFIFKYSIFTNISVSEKKADYFVKNGVVHGPYEEVNNPVFSENNESYGIIYSSQNKYYAHINGKTFGPYLNIVQLSFDSSGKEYCFGYLYNKNLWYVKMNTKEYGPFNKINYCTWDSNNVTIYYDDYKNTVYPK
ncbi:MAG: hypothetical protein HPY53_13935 [Brevinematales bacterium]|nr:hypothetical protein [Brevinematales bacterium]